MNGFINVLKPPGMSSAETVGVVKRIFGAKKAGHTGTLDPAAAGVLPICLGRATKFSDYVMKSDKEYIAEITFGIKTDTLDSAGKIIARDDGIVITKSRLEEVLPQLTGQIEQTIPAYSAIKIKGQRLYKAALKNQISQLPKRKVFIKNADILSGGNNRFLLKIECTKGTYIRSFIEDLGTRLNSYAFTSFLLRKRSGIFEIEKSYTLNELNEAADKIKYIIPADEVLIKMPKVVLKDYLFEIITTGSAIDLERAGLNIDENTDYRIYCRNKFLGAGRLENGGLKLKTHYYLREN